MTNGDSTNFRSEITKIDLRYAISKWLFESTPYLFGGDAVAYVHWKHQIGNSLQIDPRAICVVGSAATGFSLNPNKNYRLLSADSDVDVAAISPMHFDIAWHWMRSLGSERHGFPTRVQNSITDHRERLVYWGAIASDRILPYLPFGREWATSLALMGKQPPLGGRDISVRIYRDFTALRTYQLGLFETLRDRELGTAT